jgi:hypothetical protein
MVRQSTRPAAVFLAPRRSKLACALPGAFDRKLRLGQVDLVRGQHELRLGREHVGELEIDRRYRRPQGRCRQVRMRA